MRTIATATLALLLCSGSARAADVFLKTVLDLYCDGSEPMRNVGYGTLTIVSDTEWALCRPPPLCRIAPMGGTTITGTTAWLSPQRGVFLGSSGGTVFEATFLLDREGAVKHVRGRSITVAPDYPGSCAGRARFKSVRRMK